MTPTLTNAQAALAAAAAIAPTGGVPSVQATLGRAEKFKEWLDENTPES